MRTPRSAAEHIEALGPLDAGTPARGIAPDPLPPPTPRILSAPAAARDRPWVGSRFIGGMAVAVPISILLWAGIIWLIIQIFFR